MIARKPRSSMRASPRVATRPERGQDSASDQSENFTHLKPSLRLPEFVAQFAVRAGRLLMAQSVVLALAHNQRMETVFATGLGRRKVDFDWRVLNEALTALVHKSSQEIFEGRAEELLGSDFADWRRISIVHLTGTSGDRLGALCLLDCARRLVRQRKEVVETLRSHASIALENSRLFSRIEHSKRQWVEDFDAISDFIVAHDPSNVILRVNRSLASALKSVPSELVGKNAEALAAIVPGCIGVGCPFCQYEECSKRGQVITSGARALLISTSRIGSVTDDGSRTIHVLKDITEQRRYQAQLQRERDFNEKVLNSTQSMIVVLDTAGLVSYANRRCYESGYTKESLIGSKLSDFVSADRRHLFEAAFEAAVQGTATESLELPIRRGNRNIGQFAMTLSPMRDERGGVNSIIAVITDITEAAVLQAQLRHSEKMAAIGQLVAGVAHEINNPLAAIVGYSDLLLEEGNLGGAEKEQLSIISKEAGRARDIVQNLLRFAREMPVKRKPVDVHMILREALQLRGCIPAAEGIRIIERFGSGLPLILGDAQQLQQVFMNILNNAYDSIHHSGRDGKIIIETCQRDRLLEIAFCDNGIGISDPVKVFEPFYTTKEVGKGTGLGLSICYGIIREHGGEISCSNNADWEGCTFVLQLPVAADEGKLTEKRAFADA